MASDGVYFDTDTKLMLHMDGTDASTTFTDSSSGGKTVTAVGNAQIDTAVKVFGTGSGLLDGTGDYLSIGDSDDFHLAAGNFTIETRMYFGSTATNQTIVAQWNRYVPEVSFLFVWITTNALRFVYSTDGVATAVKDFAFTPSTSTWYHIALVRNGADLMCFVDGTQVGSTLSVGTDSFNNCASSVFIGAQNSTAADPNPASLVTGQFDEFRFVKGTAVWTSNFTPPSTAYIQFGSDAVSGFSNLPLLGIG